MNKRRKYTREFKEEAVRLITEQGYQLAEAARNLGVNASVLGRWKRDVEGGGEGASENGDQKAVQAEVNRLPQGKQTSEVGARNFKKSGGLLCEGVGLRYQCIDTARKVYSTALLCEVLRVSRSGYYAWRERGTSLRQQKNETCLSGCLPRHPVLDEPARRAIGDRRAHGSATYAGLYERA
jgi:transposase